MFSIAICRATSDKWQSKTLFLTIYDPRSSIDKSVFDCRLPGLFTMYQRSQITFVIFFSALLSEFQCSPGIEVSFLIDASGSVGENNFLKVQNFTQDVTRQLKSQYEKLNLTIITFNNEAKVMPIKRIHIPISYHTNKLSYVLFHFIQPKINYLLSRLLILGNQIYNSLKSIRA